MKKFFLMVLLAVLFFDAGAQNGALTRAQIASMKEEGVQLIVRFQSNLKDLASKSNSLSERQLICNLCKGLFYARGGKYVDSYGRQDSCTIELIRSYRDQTRIPKIVCGYLDGMAKTQLNLKIEDCNTIRIDNPYKRPDGRYECNAHFYQAYIKYSSDGSKVIYADETVKTAVLIIETEVLPDGSMEFYIRIEDIKAEECKQYGGYR